MAPQDYEYLLVAVRVPWTQSDHSFLNSKEWVDTAIKITGSKRGGTFESAKRITNHTRLIAQAGWCVASCRTASCHCATLSSSNHAGWLLCCLSLRRRLILSSRRTLVLSLHCPLVVSSCCLVFALERVGEKFVTDAKLHETVQQGPCHCPPNLTRGARDDGSYCPPLPRKSNVVVGVGLAIASPLP